MKIVTVAILLAACLVVNGVSQAQEDTSEVPVRCYESDIAYLTGAMNIRERASTSSRIVRQSRTGESFDILSSQQGSTYCWLEAEDGWIAETRLVQSSVARSHQELPNCTKSDVDAYVESMRWFGEDLGDIWYEYTDSRNERDIQKGIRRFFRERDDYVLSFPICNELIEIRDLFIITVHDMNIAMWMQIAGVPERNNLFHTNALENSERMSKLAKELAGAPIRG